MPKPLRKDAQRKRDLLIEAARGLYAVRGLEVALEEIAKAAGVSIGTLYNHFPQRADLVSAVFADRTETVVSIAEHALGLDDAWAGLTSFVERICELQAADHGYNELASTRPPQTGNHERGYELMTRVVERAKASGALRPDFTLEDMAFVTWGIARTVEATAAVRPEVWRRHLALLFDGMRASAASPLPEPPLGREELARLMGNCD